MGNSRADRIGSWALNVGKSGKSLEPTRRAAANSWFQGRYLQSPPAIAKQRHLLRTAKQRKHTIFVEAGTYKGQTTAFMAPHVDHVYSVELHDGLYAEAVKRFADDGLVATASSPTEFAAFVRDEIAEWSKLVQEMKLPVVTLGSK